MSDRLIGLVFRSIVYVVVFFLVLGWVLQSLAFLALVVGGVR